MVDYYDMLGCPKAPPSKSDLDGNGCVGKSDFDILIENLDLLGCANDATPAQGDITGPDGDPDGCVNKLDFDALIEDLDLLNCS